MTLHEARTSILVNLAVIGSKLLDCFSSLCETYKLSSPVPMTTSVCATTRGHKISNADGTVMEPQYNPPRARGNADAGPRFNRHERREMAQVAVSTKKPKEKELRRHTSLTGAQFAVYEKDEEEINAGRRFDWFQYWKQVESFLATSNRLLLDQALENGGMQAKQALLADAEIARCSGLLHNDEWRMHHEDNPVIKFLAEASSSHVFTIPIVPPAATAPHWPTQFAGIGSDLMRVMLRMEAIIHQFFPSAIIFRFDKRDPSFDPSGKKISDVGNHEVMWRSQVQFPSLFDDATQTSLARYKFTFGVTAQKYGSKDAYPFMHNQARIYFHGSPGQNVLTVTYFSHSIMNAMGLPVLTRHLTPLLDADSSPTGLPGAFPTQIWEFVEAQRAAFDHVDILPLTVTHRYKFRNLIAVLRKDSILLAAPPPTATQFTRAVTQKLLDYQEMSTNTGHVLTFADTRDELHVLLDPDGDEVEQVRVESAAVTSATLRVNFDNDLEYSWKPTLSSFWQPLSPAEVANLQNGEVLCVEFRQWNEDAQIYRDITQDDVMIDETRARRHFCVVEGVLDATFVGGYRHRDAYSISSARDRPECMAVISETVMGVCECVRCRLDCFSLPVLYEALEWQLVAIRRAMEFLSGEDIPVIYATRSAIPDTQRDTGRVTPAIIETPPGIENGGSAGTWTPTASEMEARYDEHSHGQKGHRMRLNPIVFRGEGEKSAVPRPSWIVRKQFRLNEAVIAELQSLFLSRDWGDNREYYRRTKEMLAGVLIRHNRDLAAGKRLNDNDEAIPRVTLSAQVQRNIVTTGTTTGLDDNGDLYREVGGIQFVQPAIMGDGRRRIEEKPVITYVFQSGTAHGWTPDDWDYQRLHPTAAIWPNLCVPYNRSYDRVNKKWKRPACSGMHGGCVMYHVCSYCTCPERVTWSLQQNRWVPNIWFVCVRQCCTDRANCALFRHDLRY